jgi:antitoxin component of MazEF toxin-antitoxin module
MATPVKVKKWGSSLAVRIPSQFAKTRRIQVGSVLDLEPVKLVKAAPTLQALRAYGPVQT